MQIQHENRLPTISYGLSGHVLVVSHSSEDPAAADWTTLLTFAAPRVRAGTIAGIMIGTKGGAPRAAQRRQMVKAYDGCSVPVAVLSESAVNRAIMTAVSYFFKGAIRLFAPPDLLLALSFLGVPAARIDETAATIRDFMHGTS